MARKPLDYGILNIGGSATGEGEGATPAVPDAPLPQPPETSRPNDPDAHLVKNRAQQVIIYMRPEAHKALNRYALEQSTFKNKIKPHDLLVEAVQEWFDRHGLREQVKVPAEKGRA
jgi:hypothetical protein